MAVKKSKKTNNPKLSLGRDKQTRMDILRTIADLTGLPKVQIEAVFNSLTELMHSHMRKKGSGEFTIPMVGIKVRRIKKKATKSRQMTSPLTGQEVVISGKPARLAVKLSVLKPLKLAVQA
jgi:hypothetical protein